MTKRFDGTNTYVATEDLKVAVNAAVTLERPLLVKGEPGTGKTILAEEIAAALDVPLIQWHIKSTTRAQQGLYEYDAVARLRDSQLGEARVHDIRNYIVKGRLWESFIAEVRPVLLIDEIDKADIEFPDDLLLELDRMEFHVYETKETIAARHRPIVIITSNNEKELPDAFLRRCFFHYIRFPDRETMESIVEVHFPGIHKRLLHDALSVFFEIREVPGLKKKPSTSELLDWLKLLLAEDVPPEVLRSASARKLIPPLHGALLKNEQDIHLFERLAFLHRREGVLAPGGGPMFIDFFLALREARLPVSLREYLTLMEAMDAGVAAYSVDDFYYLSRSCLVKDETNLDKFDRVFGAVFKGLEPPEEGESAAIPEEWLRKLAERELTEEEKAQVEALGGWDKLMETLKRRLEEQKGRHQGGSKWIGTAGTSPFGSWGYNPEGIRIGQDKNRHNRAVKVWDKREFQNLDSDVELGTRTIKVALRRLRRFAREGAASELDLAGTIDATARKGYLDLRMVPERHNAAKVLLFLDVGGSMEPHVKICEELFSAARSEFKHLEYFYFHNCLYERVWRDNRRRRTEATPTLEVLHTYPHDYKVIFVGDASMSPYEIVNPGGSVEHWNEEAGGVWMTRALEVYAHAVWLNPVPEPWWDHTASTRILRQLFAGRMFPLTLDGLDRAMRCLSR